MALLDATDKASQLASMAKPYHFTPQMGEVVGEHNGAHYFTIGQRKGLNVGGKPLPLFVIGIDVAENVIYTGQGQAHRGLYRKACLLKMKNYIGCVRI